VCWRWRGARRRRYYLCTVLFKLVVLFILILSSIAFLPVGTSEFAMKTQVTYIYLYQYTILYVPHKQQKYITRLVLSKGGGV
jgi:hypothetical protein